MKNAYDAITVILNVAIPISPFLNWKFSSKVSRKRMPKMQPIRPAKIMVIALTKFDLISSIVIFVYTIIKD